MTVAWVTLKKELASYLFAPAGYVVAFLLYLYRGFEVDRMVHYAGAVGIEREQFATLYLLQQSSLLLLILVPAILTMRCFAEEKRTGSIEVLLTAPVRDLEIVVGKWLAALVFFALLWLPAIVVLIVMQGDGYLGTTLPAGPILSGFLGVLLVGALLLAVGCFTSSLTDNQLLASLSAMLFSWALLYGPAQFAAPGVAEPAGVPPEQVDAFTAWIRSLSEWFDQNLLRPVVEQVNVIDHLQAWFFRGIVNSAHVAFYVAGTACFLFLTARSLEARRWR